MKPIRLAPEAAEELREAVSWYEGRQRRLGARMLSETGDVLKRIRARPRSFAKVHAVPPDIEIRRGVLPHFPYALVFVELVEEIRVLAVAHLKRLPEYWLDRLAPKRM